MCNLAQGILITGLLFSDDYKTTHRRDTPLRKRLWLFMLYF